MSKHDYVADRPIFVGLRKQRDRYIDLIKIASRDKDQMNSAKNMINFIYNEFYRRIHEAYDAVEQLCDKDSVEQAVKEAPAIEENAFYHVNLACDGHPIISSTSVIELNKGFNECPKGVKTKFIKQKLTNAIAITNNSKPGIFVEHGPVEYFQAILDGITGDKKDDTQLSISEAAKIISSGDNYPRIKAYQHSIKELD